MVLTEIRDIIILFNIDPSRVFRFVNKMNSVDLFEDGLGD